MAECNNPETMEIDPPSISVQIEPGINQINNVQTEEDAELFISASQEMRNKQQSTTVPTKVTPCRIPGSNPNSKPYFMDTEGNIYRNGGDYKSPYPCINKECEAELFVFTNKGFKEYQHSAHVNDCVEKRPAMVSNLYMKIDIIIKVLFIPEISNTICIWQFINLIYFVIL